MSDYRLNKTTMDNINHTLLNTIGMTYEEYDALDADEQYKIMSEYHKKSKKKWKRKSKDTDGELVMIGSGEHAIFARFKKGERVLIGEGEHSCFVEVGVTPEESRARLNAELEKIFKKRN